MSHPTPTTERAASLAAPFNHHTTPGADTTPSAAFPTMVVTGDRYEMLREDMAFAAHADDRAYDELTADMDQMFTSSGAYRARCRAYVAVSIAKLRKTRQRRNEAFQRVLADAAERQMMRDGVRIAA